MDAQNRAQGPTQEADHSTAKPEPKNSNRAREKFAEPRGWAMKWDGFGLSEIGTRQDRDIPSPTVESR